MAAIPAAYVLLLSLTLAGSLAAGDYYPSSGGATATHASFQAIKPQYKPEPEELKKPKGFTFPTFGEGPKPDFYKPRVEPAKKPEPTKPEPTKPKANVYGQKPKKTIPKPAVYGGEVFLKKLAEDSYPIAIEGTVICKSGSQFVPIQGAVVRITCWGVEEEGYKATQLAWKTRPTDVKGYFFKTLHSSNNNVKNFVDKCKAYIERSPMKECSVASDVNKGITGSPLSSYRILHDKRIKLYPVGPFFYTPYSPKPAANTPDRY